jgi:hypothetical protein
MPVVSLQRAWVGGRFGKFSDAMRRYREGAIVLILVLGEDSRRDQISGARLVQGCADSNCAAKPHKRPSRPRVATS